MNSSQLMFVLFCFTLNLLVRSSWCFRMNHVLKIDDYESIQSDWRCKSMMLKLANNVDYWFLIECGLENLILMKSPMLRFGSCVVYDFQKFGFCCNRRSKFWYHVWIVDNGTNVSFGFGTICDWVKAKLLTKLMKFSSIFCPNCE